jgi:glycosyltransferase involved in cell wall biosynthesis
LHEKKRPLETVAAVAAAENLKVHLAVLGGDETITTEIVRATGQRLGMQDRLHVPGAVYGEEKEAWLHACDGFISLSLQENFGYSAAEALSAGKPVILTPGNDLGGDLARVNCGWFLSDDLPLTAAAAVREWATVPAAELRERGARGLEFVRRELSFDRFAGNLRQLEAETLARA